MSRTKSFYWESIDSYEDYSSGYYDRLVKVDTKNDIPVTQKETYDATTKFEEDEKD